MTVEVDVSVVISLFLTHSRQICAKDVTLQVVFPILGMTTVIPFGIIEMILISEMEMVSETTVSEISTIILETMDSAIMVTIAEVLALVCSVTMVTMEEVMDLEH